jgi:hypothetical protein
MILTVRTLSENWENHDDVRQFINLCSRAQSIQVSKPASNLVGNAKPSNLARLSSFAVDRTQTMPSSSPHHKYMVVLRLHRFMHSRLPIAPLCPTGGIALAVSLTSTSPLLPKAAPMNSSGSWKRPLRMLAVPESSSERAETS